MISEKGFRCLGTERQVEGLTKLALTALREWDLANPTVELIKYRENAVFAVRSASGRRHVLRVHRPRYRTDDHIRSEFAFMSALSAAEILTPEAVPTKDGDTIVTTHVDGVPEPRQCDLFTWVDGDQLGSLEDWLGGGEADVAKEVRSAGELAARIHNHAASWARPDWFSRPAFDMEALVGHSPVWGRFWNLASIEPAPMSVLIEARDRVRARLVEFGTSPDRYGLIHGDLLPENILVGKEGTRLIDFDDCGNSWYLLELVTALFALRFRADFETFLAAFLDGYRRHRALPEEHLTMVPTLVMARALSYLGWPDGRPEMEVGARMVSELAPLALMLAEDYLQNESGGL